MPQSPLYDIFDPTGSISGRYGEDPTLEDLMPEEEKRSRLRELANMGSNGIAGLGWLLDTPGAVIRGALSGGIGKGVSALWDTSEDRVTGRELLRQYGMAGDEDNWQNFAGGLATEVLLDPTSWLSLGLNQVLGKGAKTVGGELLAKAGGLEGADVAARQAGRGIRTHLRQSTVEDILNGLHPSIAPGRRQQFEALAKEYAAKPPSMVEQVFGTSKRSTVDELLAQPVTRTNRFGVPGTDLGAFDLYGQKAGDWLAETADNLGEASKQLPVVGHAYRTAQAVFNPAVDKALNYDQQWNNRILAADQKAKILGEKTLRSKLVYDANEEQIAAYKQWADTHQATISGLEKQVDDLGLQLQSAPPAAAPALQQQLQAATDELAKQQKLLLAEGPIQIHSPEWSQAFRHAAEETDQYGPLPSPLDPSFVGPRTKEELAKEARLELAQELFSGGTTVATNNQTKLLQAVQAARQRRIQAAKSLGIPLSEYESKFGFKHVPRQQLWFPNKQTPEWPAGVNPATPREQATVSGGLQVAPLADAHSKSRQDYMDMFGGTPVINAMSTDGGLQEALRNAPNTDVRKIFGDWLTSRFGQWAHGNTSANNPLYGWVDEIDPATGQYANPLPQHISLPLNHPLLKQQRAIEKALAKKPDEAVLTARINSLNQTLNTPGISPFAAAQANSQLAATAAELQSVQAAAKTLASTQQQIQVALRDTYSGEMYDNLAHVVRGLDPQHAETNLPMFGGHVLNELDDYATSRGKIESTADYLLDMLERNMSTTPDKNVVGGVNYNINEAASALGFDVDALKRVLKQRAKLNKKFDMNTVSFPQAAVDQWTRRIKPSSPAPELEYLRNLGSDYTKTFKTLALFSPSRWMRDQNSGAFSSAMKGLYSWADRSAAIEMRKGNYAPLAKRLEGAIGYEKLSPEERIRKFLMFAGAHGMTGGSVMDELTAAAPAAQLREFYPGMSRPEGIVDSIKGFPQAAAEAKLSDWSPFKIRGPSGNANPILNVGDTISDTTDAANRYGAYLTAVRKGYHPSEARRLSDLTQVNYRPDAFTDYERNYIKPLLPFYSYTKGIMPLVQDEILNNPSGLMGQTVRTMARGSEPNEDFFVPEYLRQSSSIPIPGGVPLLGLAEDSPLQRFITRIDLPFEGPVNLVSPGTGNSILDKLSSGAYKTGQNLLGMTHPLFKGPLELMTNRQFYSGRQLSDLYSMLEANTGMPSSRWLEHIAVNTPGGSKALGILRQVTDERLTPQEKLLKYGFKSATGLSFQDVDQDRTKRLAARNMLNDLLQKTPGVRTYENITVPADKLAQMPEDQKRMYLLYKILQNDAAKKARERKKEMALQDPLAALGVN